MKSKTVLKTIYLLFIYSFLYLPLVVLVTLSFNNMRMSFVWRGFTWKWYHVLWQDNLLQVALWHSMLVAVLAASIATFIGTLGAVALYKYRFAGKKILYGLIFVLIIVPDLVMGVSLLSFFAIFKVHLGFISLLLAHITFCIPFVMVVVYGRLSGFDKKLLEAAKDLGANDYLIFHRVILPLLKPAIIGAWLLSFALSIDDLVISFFVTGPSFQILPLYIYSQLRIGPTPEINALCTLIIAVTFILVLVAQVMLRKKVDG